MLNLSPCLFSFSTWTLLSDDCTSTEAKFTLKLKNFHFSGSMARWLDWWFPDIAIILARKNPDDDFFTMYDFFFHRWVYASPTIALSLYQIVIRNLADKNVLGIRRGRLVLKWKKFLDKINVFLGDRFVK